MKPRYLPALLFVIAAIGCTKQQPEFPTPTPAQVAQYSTGQEKAPPARLSRGVNFAMSPETRSRIGIVVSTGAAVFLLVLLIALFSAREALVPAGIAAALTSPNIAVAIGVRQLPQMLPQTRDPETALAQMSLDLWNRTQPLLYSLECAAICLIVLAVVAGVTRVQTRRATLMTILPLLVVIASAIAFFCYADVSRTVIHIVDPDHAFHANSIADVARNTAVLITTAYGVSLFTTLLIPITVILAFVVRQRPRAAAIIVLLTLVLTCVAVYCEYSWCGSLKTAAKTGHLPA